MGAIAVRFGERRSAKPHYSHAGSGTKDRGRDKSPERMVLTNFWLCHNPENVDFYRAKFVHGCPVAHN